MLTLRYNCFFIAIQLSRQSSMQKSLLRQCCRKFNNYSRISSHRKSHRVPTIIRSLYQLSRRQMYYLTTTNITTHTSSWAGYSTRCTKPWRKAAKTVLYKTCLRASCSQHLRVSSASRSPNDQSSFTTCLSIWKTTPVSTTASAGFNARSCSINRTNFFASYVSPSK